MAKSNLIDRPKAGPDQDLLGVSRYINALSKFLSNADMPTTIAIQGEWGSGKTSVINSLRYSLCDTLKQPEKGKPFHSIFLNMWEYSMLKSPEETIEGIIRGLLEEVTAFLELHGKDSGGAVETLKKISSSRLFKAALKGGSIASTLIAGKAAGAAVDSISSAITGKAETVKEFRPAEFREAVGEAIEECLRKDHEAGDPDKRGFMIFVDDLDRINPESAVQILEMLKNFFEVNQCIFVLAIDYNVVVKGLKAKLGNKDENDERAYRSFFDKIIQMPFTMPTEKYNVESYVAESLKRIGYCTDDDLSVLVIDKEGEENDRTFIQATTEITAYSTGTNPRSIKRLLNSLSLIQYMYEEDQTNKDDPNVADNQGLGDKQQVEKVINYAFVCMQIAYPDIYRLLVKDPVYIDWSEDTAEDFKIKDFPAFLQKWNETHSDDDEEGAIRLGSTTYKAIIHAVCKSGSTWMQNRASYIVDILVMLEEMCALNKRDFKQLIPAILDMSSVTAVSSEEDKAAKVKRIANVYDVRNKFWDEFLDYAFQNPQYVQLFKRKRATKGWSNMWISAKTGDFWMVLNNKMGQNHIHCHIPIFNEFLMEHLKSKKEWIEAFAGIKYDWRGNRSRKGFNAKIVVSREFDTKDPANWKEVFDWFIDMLIRSYKPFAYSRRTWLSQENKHYEDAINNRLVEPTCEGVPPFPQPSLTLEEFEQRKAAQQANVDAASQYDVQDDDEDEDEDDSAEFN